MKPGRSIRTRLLVAAALVLLAFIAGAGLAVQRAHADSVRAVHFDRLQTTIYLLLARAELDESGALVMPPGFAEPRLTLPQSGLYASIHNVTRDERWHSPSSLGADPPFPAAPLAAGQWRNAIVEGAGRTFLATSYGVNWAAGRHQAPLVLTVLDDSAGFEREAAVFARTLWTWLGGAGLLLLLAQGLLLRWGLAPLRRVAAEIHDVESGRQGRIEGRYPSEIADLTDNLNALLRHERVREGPYQGALGFLGHSLRTPLAVLRGLGLPDDAPHVNPHGGAIALGHPLGMSGARLALTAMRALETRGARRALVTLCVGVGQGLSLAIERA